LAASPGAFKLQRTRWILAIESTDPVHALVCGGDLESPRSHHYALGRGSYLNHSAEPTCRFCGFAQICVQQPETFSRCDKSNGNDKIKII
jgi:hypothetical protein